MGFGNGRIAHNAGKGSVTISTVEEFEAYYLQGQSFPVYLRRVPGHEGYLGLGMAEWRILAIVLAKVHKICYNQETVRE